MTLVGGVIVAAGRGDRFGETHKILSIVAGRPMLAWSLDAFETCPEIRDIIVVVGSHTRDEVQVLLATGRWSKVTAIVEGGTTRSDSVSRGLNELASDIEIAVIHDAARPMTTAADIVRTAEAALEVGAAIMAIPVSDTLKRVDDKQIAVATIDRSTMWAAQTPQAFRRTELLQAFEASGEVHATDEATLFENLGKPVRIVPGSRENMKVTVPEDLAIVDFLMRKRLETQ